MPARGHGDHDRVGRFQEFGERRLLLDAQLGGDSAATRPLHIEDARVTHALQIANHPRVVPSQRTDADNTNGGRLRPAPGVR